MSSCIQARIFALPKKVNENLCNVYVCTRVHTHTHTHMHLKKALFLPLYHLHVLQTSCSPGFWAVVDGDYCVDPTVRTGCLPFLTTKHHTQNIAKHARPLVGSLMRIHQMYFLSRWFLPVSLQWIYPHLDQNSILKDYMVSHNSVTYITSRSGGHKSLSSSSYL